MSMEASVSLIDFASFPFTIHCPRQNVSSWLKAVDCVLRQIEYERSINLHLPVIKTGMRNRKTFSFVSAIRLYNVAVAQYLEKTFISFRILQLTSLQL